MINNSISLTATLTTTAISITRFQGINNFGGGNFTVANGFTNTGTLELTDAVAGYGATLTVTNGTLVNPVGGTLSILQGSSGPRTLAVQLDNQDRKSVV